MKKSTKAKHRAQIKNRAQRTDEPPKRAHCDSCSNQLLFAMRDDHHEFTLDVATVLECLRAAEDYGAVPVLPAEWWSAVTSHYRQDIPRFEEDPSLSGTL